MGFGVGAGVEMPSAAVTDRWSIKNTQAMEQEQFELWQALLEDRTGMTLNQERKTFLETSLSIRMRELGIAEYDDYYEQLVVGSTESKAMEWSVLVDRLTVQETSFFRHPSSYALIEEYIADFVATKGKSESLDIWSVGCSTGEEPYSIAMMASEIFTQAHGKAYFGVTATDISLPTLSKARRGVYSARKVELIDVRLRDQYFQKLNDREYQVADVLRDRICFARLNVLDLARAPMKNMDLIFCQNMLIYFRRWRKKQIVARLAERLAPGGMLVLGLGEVTDFHHPNLERVPFADVLAYRRKD